MSRVIKLQTNFTVGEINPELRGRIDLQQYESALERARNVIINPRGTVDRRPGLKFNYQIASAAAPQNGVRLVPFAFSTTQTYMLVFTTGRMHVIKDGAIVTAINGTGNEYLDVSSSVSGVTDGIAAAQLGDMWYTQSADTLLIFQEDMTPIKIVRGATHATWTVSDITFESIPRYLFTSTETNPAATLTPSATDGKIDITAGASIWHSGRSNTAQAGASATITLDSGASATDDIFNGATITTTGGTGSGQTRIISDYVGSSKVATVSVAWTTQPASDTTFVIESHVGQKVYDSTSGIGLARIIEVESATVVKAVTETPFFNTDAIASGNWTLQQGWANAWSNTKGWPRTATFHEGRLIVGGAKSLPTTVWGSKVGFFFDYDPGQSLDDEGLEATIDTDQVNAVTAVMSGRDLQVFTTGTEFTVPQLDGEPLTPTSFLFKPATRRGSASGVRPQMTEGGTIYLQRGGKSLRELIFSDVEGSFVSNDISLLSSHLLQSPTAIVMRRGTNVDEGDLMMVVNGGTGSLAGSIAAFSILRSQNVIAPSLLTTEGTFVDVAIEDADTPAVYTVVKRTVPDESTCTITVTDYANIASGSTIVLQTSAGTSVTITSAGSAGTNQWQSVTSNNQTATNLAAAINGNANFTANASTNVVTVTRAAIGKENLTVTSSDSTRLAVTNFVNTEVYYLEVFDSNFTTDSAVQFSSSAGNLPGSTTVNSGINHLEDFSVEVIADDAMLTSKTVASNAITTDRTATTYMEIGLEFPTFTDDLSDNATKSTPLIRTMPVETRLSSGPVTGFLKRIIRASVILDDTQNLTVNGEQVAFRRLDNDQLDSGIAFFTGTKRAGPFLGYDREGQVEITQSAPLFMTLLAVDYQVSVGQ